MMKLRSVALLCMITCGYSWAIDDLRKTANDYLNKVEFSSAATGNVLSRRTYNTVPYGDIDRKQVKASDVDGQPIDPAMLELLTDSNLSDTFNGLSDGHYYGTCCQKVIDILTAGFAYDAMVNGSGWKSHAWIAGCRNADKNAMYNKDRQDEDKFMSTKLMPKHGTFNAEKNSIPTDALNDAQNVQLKSITAWQRPLLVGGPLAIARGSINSWASLPVWDSLIHYFTFTQDMKYAVRDVMEHWFLVCKFEYKDQPIYVRIERTQTGIFVSRCEDADVSVGASWDADACGSGHLGAQKIANTHKQAYASDSPVKGSVSLEDVLNFCKGQEGNKYSMFFNNCRQFAKAAFDKFTIKELQIPSLDKGFFEQNGYGPDGDHTY